MINFFIKYFNALLTIKKPDSIILDNTNSFEFIEKTIDRSNVVWFIRGRLFTGLVFFLPYTNSGKHTIVFQIYRTGSIRLFIFRPEYSQTSTIQAWGDEEKFFP